MVEDCGCHQRRKRAVGEDFNSRMRTKFVHTLANYQLELKGLKTRFEFEKAKPLDEADDEFIDVTGDDSSEVQPKIIPNLEQPPSKIYYDNIEKESSDGGFFDRDDLEDEDEKNDLIIDCKLNNGETWEKKTESGICSRTGDKPTTEPELVFNFTVVDTQLIYNEADGTGSKLSHSKDRCGDNDGPVVSITIPSPKRAHPVEQKQSLLAAKLKEVRVHPYARTSPKLSSRARRIDEYPSSLSIPVPNDSFYRKQEKNEPIGSRFRPSAFSPPAKVHVVPQSVHLKPSIRPSTKSISLSSLQLPPPQILRKPPPKKLYHQLSQVQQSVRYPPFHQHTLKIQTPMDKQQHPERLILLPEVQKSPRYLPPQFGFGSAVLQNLYDPEQPLDFSKNSLLCQYENMLKCSHQQQLRQGHSILRSMPLPAPPKPPKSASRPKVVPLKQHPTLYRIHQANNRPSNESFNSCPKAPISPEPPLIVTETFRQHMNLEIEKFFTRRQNEICQALRLFATENINLEDLFRRLEHFQVRFSRDYNGLACTMVERYGYRIRRGLHPTQLSYRFKEQPQTFAEYFRSVQDSLRPHVPEETLNIYRLVVGSLLEQFRDSLEHFLSRNLH
ncbi:uncharacterized protein LOC5579101 isoform X2 [Aedes aegypti]|uniref:uncharacterized protein LOC5579101 isoform 2 n=1 Tax=Aedes aegypti TaxID=7159 RepID=UPI000B788469|nr:uncharacterized protein LOC5579101 isoform 2 [Aedes aegypti]